MTGKRPLEDPESLAALVRTRLAHGAGRVIKQTPSDVVLEDPSSDAALTIRIRDDEVTAVAGTVANPTTRITADAETLRGVVEGRLSGVEAFLNERLVARGNLALALQLDGLFHPSDDRPERFPRTGSVRVEGVRTLYMEAGPADGPVVLLLHGLSATNASFLTTLWELASDHRVIAPDLPGHGGSSAPLGRYDASFYARWAVAFLDELGVDQTVLVGNSLGGRIALEIGLCAPERVRGLMLLAPAVAFRKLRQFVPLVSVLRPDFGMLPLLLPVALRRALPVKGIPLLFADPSRVSAPYVQAAADEFARVYAHRRQRVALLSSLQNIYLDAPFGRGGFWGRLPTLEVPALFIWGQHDRLVPSRFARHVQEAVPDATSVVLPDCGHVPQWELPEETHRLMRKFLANLT